MSLSRGASWGKDGTIVFAPNRLSGLLKIPATGGQPQALTKLETGERSHRWPQFLPDGQHVLFMVAPANSADERTGQIEVVDVSNGKRKVLKGGCTYARYAPSGHLLFVMDGTLHAAAFDLDELEMKGQPLAIVPAVSTNREGGAQYDVSPDGTLVYLTGAATTTFSLVWLDKQGKLTSATQKIGEFGPFDLSPDDKHGALTLGDHIHVLDIERNVLRRFTLHDGPNRRPVWSPDGQWIVFTSQRGGKYGLWRKRSDWSGEEEQLFEQAGYSVVLSPGPSHHVRDDASEGQLDRTGGAGQSSGPAKKRRQRYPWIPAHLRR